MVSKHNTGIIKRGTNLVNREMDIKADDEEVTLFFNLGIYMIQYGRRKEDTKHRIALF